MAEYKNEEHGRWRGSRAALGLRQLSKLEGNDTDFGANFEMSMEPPPEPGDVATPEPKNTPFRHAETHLDPYAGK